MSFGPPKFHNTKPGARKPVQWRRLVALDSYLGDKSFE